MKLLVCNSDKNHNAFPGSFSGPLHKLSEEWCLMKHHINRKHANFWFSWAAVSEEELSGPHIEYMIQLMYVSSKALFKIFNSFNDFMKQHMSSS